LSEGHKITFLQPKRFQHLLWYNDLAALADPADRFLQ
jgi:hypothetical protein